MGIATDQVLRGTNPIVKGDLADDSEKGRRRTGAHQRLMQYSTPSQSCKVMSSFLSSGPCINACGQWPCPFPPIYKSEILHPIPPSSINSSQMYIQFKIPLLVFNPPWTCSRLLHILSLSLTSSNHLPLLFSQKLVPFLSNLLNSLLISLGPDNSLFITFLSYQPPKYHFTQKPFSDNYWRCFIK